MTKCEIIKGVGILLPTNVIKDHISWLIFVAKKLQKIALIYISTKDVLHNNSCFFIISSYLLREHVPVYHSLIRKQIAKRWGHRGQILCLATRLMIQHNSSRGYISTKLCNILNSYFFYLFTAAAAKLTFLVLIIMSSEYDKSIINNVNVNKKVVGLSQNRKGSECFKCFIHSMLLLLFSGFLKDLVLQTLHKTRNCVKDICVYKLNFP